MGTEWTHPKETLRLLDELESLGFTDEYFARSHHFREKGKRDTMRSQRRYCEKTGYFHPDGNNSRVQQRLSMVLNEYKATPNARPDRFIDLVEDAYRRFPPVPF
jgi:hypothetical protein